MQDAEKLVGGLDSEVRGVGPAVADVMNQTVQTLRDDVANREKLHEKLHKADRFLTVHRDGVFDEYMQKLVRKGPYHHLDDAIASTLEEAKELSETETQDYKSLDFNIVDFSDDMERKIKDSIANALRSVEDVSIKTDTKREAFDQKVKDLNRTMARQTSVLERDMQAGLKGVEAVLKSSFSTLDGLAPPIAQILQSVLGAVGQENEKQERTFWKYDKKHYKDEQKIRKNIDAVSASIKSAAASQEQYVGRKISKLKRKLERALKRDLKRTMTLRDAGDDAVADALYGDGQAAAKARELTDSTYVFSNSDFERIFFSLLTFF